MNPRFRALKRLAAHRLAMLSLMTLLALTLFCALAPLLEFWLATDAFAANLRGRLQPPSGSHPLGTDELGRDLLVRLAYGGRISLIVGFTAAVAAAAIGTAIGVCAGFYGGWIDALTMRMTDSFIALPLLPLLIVLAAVDLTKLGIPAQLAQHESISLIRIIAIVSIVGWTGVARLVRGAALSVREQTYVLAARSLGVAPRHIITRHILTALISPIIVATTLSVGNIILFESILSFLGLGIHPPTPSWGNMLSNVQDLIWNAPRLAVFPGLMIFLTVISFNFLGDGLQDALASRSREKIS